MTDTTKGWREINTTGDEGFELTEEGMPTKKEPMTEQLSEKVKVMVEGFLKKWRDGYYGIYYDNARVELTSILKVHGEEVIKRHDDKQVKPFMVCAEKLYLGEGHHATCIEIANHSGKHRSIGGYEWD